MAPARDEDGELVLILVDEATGKRFVGRRRASSRSAGAVAASTRIELVTAPEGYTLVPPDRAARARPRARRLHRPGRRRQARSGRRASRRRSSSQPTLRYDPAADTFTRIADGTVFRDNGKGSFVAASGEELEPGWRTHIGLANFSAVLTDPLVRDPFVRVFVWTFVFAIADRARRRSRSGSSSRSRSTSRAALPALYRSLLVIPYAIPGFLSLLVWAGPPERRLRRRQQRPAPRHPLALRPELGEGLGASSSASG